MIKNIVLKFANKQICVRTKSGGDIFGILTIEAFENNNSLIKITKNYEGYSYEYFLNVEDIEFISEKIIKDNNGD